MPGEAVNTHPCPGCGEVEVAARQLSCRPCWFLLPADIRKSVNDAFRARERGVEGAVAKHRRAITEALDWYRDREGSAGG